MPEKELKDKITETCSSIIGPEIEIAGKLCSILLSRYDNGTVQAILEELETLRLDDSLDNYTLTRFVTGTKPNSQEFLVEYVGISEILKQLKKTGAVERILKPQTSYRLSDLGWESVRLYHLLETALINPLANEDGMNKGTARNLVYEAIRDIQKDINKE